MLVDGVGNRIATSSPRITIAGQRTERAIASDAGRSGVSLEFGFQAS